MRKRILLLYPYYWPLFRAGGPVQSLFNLVANFKDQSDFYLISLNKDINGEEPIDSLVSGTWTKGPNNENIYFTPFISPTLLFRLISEVKPDLILINGIFHWHTSLFGLVCARLKSIKTVISPRGMLQEWGLKRGSIKKRIYLAIFKLFVSKESIWHATDEQEKIDIMKIFGKDQDVHVASNIPRSVGHVNSIPFPDQSGKIKLVFLSLINPNKNLHLIIDAVNQLPDSYTLDIYGPIIDENYWEICNGKIINSSVSYRGSIPPWDVPQTIQSYHFFVLPTQGENFGHAIFDALSSGVPVIISLNTPWKDIDKTKAGFYIDIDNPNSLKVLLDSISLLSADDYKTYRTQSLRYASTYLSSKNYSKEYDFLIGASNLMTKQIISAK
jgi:glycosyltransferase involved in cell wall biosynthesis